MSPWQRVYTYSVSDYNYIFIGYTARFKKMQATWIFVIRNSANCLTVERAVVSPSPRSRSVAAAECGTSLSVKGPSMPDRNQCDAEPPHAAAGRRVRQFTINLLNTQTAAPSQTIYFAYLTYSFKVKYLANGES